MTTVTPDARSCFPARTTMADLVVTVCLPAGSTRDHRRLAIGLAAQLAPVVRSGDALCLCEASYLTRPRLSAAQQSLLVSATAGPVATTTCAGGPLGLLDLAATTTWIAQFGSQLGRHHQALVAGTPPARPWDVFLTRHRADPDAYPLLVADLHFAAQPRIAAMLAHDRTTTDPLDRFVADDYGPGLAAFQEGPAAFVDYLTGALLYGDALITTTGELLSPGLVPTCRAVQTWDQRRAFAQRARAYVSGAGPNTVLLAVSCRLFR